MANGELLVSTLALQPENDLPLAWSISFALNPIPFTLQTLTTSCALASICAIIAEHLQRQWVVESLSDP